MPRRAAGDRICRRAMRRHLPPPLGRWRNVRTPRRRSERLPMDERARSPRSRARALPRGGPLSPARGYPDLHEHVLALAREGLLLMIEEPINKDTEMHPLVRWQFRGGIPETRAQGVPVHPADRFKGPALSISPCWSRALPPTATSIASASASRSRTSGRTWLKAMAGANRAARRRERRRARRWL